jgi:hypothetical protein
MGKEDAELKAMQQVVDALHDLNEETQGRVLEWAARRFNLQVTDRVRSQDVSGGRDNTEFEDFADLLDATNPRTEDERALVGGYWFLLRGNQSFAGGQVNDALKDTGQGVGNITRSLDRLQGRTPALVRQVSKSGRSKQARKTYKLTTAGIGAVQRMIHREGADDEAEE